MITIPELPEVENVVISLNNHNLIGKKINKCFVQNSKLIKSHNISRLSNSFKSDIEGQIIRDIYREGKYIVIKTTDHYLIFHLAMTGAILYKDDKQDIPMKYAKHVHIIFKLNENESFCYADIRRFGKVWLLNQNEYDNFSSIKELGIDVVKSELTVENIIELENKIKNTNKSIKEALMNQKVISGIGNIYANEILFICKINPVKDCLSLTYREIESIYMTATTILENSIADGGCSISDYMNADGVMGKYQNKLNVYGKHNCDCPRCKNKIKKVEIAKRSTFYCDKCQS